MFSAGILAFWKFKATVEEPFIPNFFSSAPIENPSVPDSTKKPVSFPSSWAKTVKSDAQPPFVIKTFSPFRIYDFPSSDNLAVVLAPIASDPEDGSDKP